LQIVSKAKCMCDNCGCKDVCEFYAVAIAPVIQVVEDTSYDNTDHTSVAYISKLADASDILDDKAMRYLEHDIFCSHVYESVISQKLCTDAKNEFQRQLIII